MSFIASSLPFILVLLGTGVLATVIGLVSEGFVARLRLGWNASAIFNGPRKA